MSVPKKPNANPAQRWDLTDHLYSIQDFPAFVRDELFRSVIGTGILDGFRIHVIDQVGFDVGHVEVFNGYASDWQGRFINAQTGTNSQRVILQATTTEYWLEVELAFTPTDPDSRAFWDALIDNPDPFPDGNEINVPNIFTRLTPFWRIKRPIRSNTADRGAGGYAPSGFSPSNEFTIPIAIIRTDASRQILSGDANTSPTANDIITVTTALGTRQFIKTFGYGEANVATSSGANGRLFSDQRPRLFERLHAPMVYGDSGEVQGDARSDLWARDLKSWADHVMTAIQEIKTGANDEATQIGDFNNGVISAFATDFSYVTLSDVQDTTAATMLAEAGKFIGCTFMVTSGNWNGFYAKVANNDATDGGGNTRIYLQHLSSLPTWKDLPVSGATCRLVQHRRINWLTKPSPSSSFRGLNALDTEVVNARTDAHTNQVYSTLVERLDKNKGPYVTIGWGDVVASRPSDIIMSTTDSTPLATTALINTLVNDSFSGDGGGTVLFRAGTYNLNSYISGGVVFTFAAKGIEIAGEGKDATILEISSGTNNLIMNVGITENVVIRDLTLKSIGQLASFSISSEKITFERCKIESTFSATTDKTIDFADTTNVTFRDCEILCSGRGLEWTTMTGVTFENCKFQVSNLPVNTELNYFINSTGAATNVFISNCVFTGRTITNGNAILFDSISESSIHNNIFRVTTQGSAIPGGAIIALGSGSAKVVSSVTCSNNKMESIAGDSFIHMGMYVGDAEESSFDNNQIILTHFGIFNEGTPQECSFSNNVMNGSGLGGSAGHGVSIEDGVRCVVGDNVLQNFPKGIYARTVNQSTISGNRILGLNIVGSTGIDALSCIQTNINGNNIEDSQEGIMVTGGSRITIADNVIKNTSLLAINGSAFFASITGNIIEGSVTDGIVMTGGVITLGAVISNNVINGISNVGANVGIDITNRDQVEITGNYINNFGTGITALGALNIGIVGNQIRTVIIGVDAREGTSVADNLRIQSNQVQSSSESFHLQKVTDCVIVGNLAFGGNRTFDLRSASDNTITGNNAITSGTIKYDLGDAGAGAASGNRGGNAPTLLGGPDVAGYPGDQLNSNVVEIYNN